MSGIKCPRCKTHSVFHKTAFPNSIAPALRVIRSAVGRLEIPTLAS